MDKRILNVVLQEAKNGNAESLNKLVKSYQQEIYRNSKLYTGNKELAKSITKNTITKVFTHLDVALEHVDHFDAWLSEETMDKALESLLPLNPFEVGELRNIGLLDDENVWAKVFAYSDGLSEGERTVLNLSAFKKMDIGSIASKIRLSQEDVQSLLDRAKDHLSKEGYSFEEYAQLLVSFEMVMPKQMVDTPIIKEKVSAPLEDMQKEAVEEIKEKPKKNGFKTTMIYILVGIIILAAEWLALDYFLGNKNKDQKVTTPKTQETAKQQESSKQSEKNNTETQSTPKETVLGKVSIIKSGLHIRNQPTTKGKDLGTLNNGDRFDVLEMKEADNYTWYRIGENKWIANPSGYVRFDKTNE